MLQQAGTADMGLDILPLLVCPLHVPTSVIVLVSLAIHYIHFIADIRKATKLRQRSAAKDGTTSTAQLTARLYQVCSNLWAWQS